MKYRKVESSDALLLVRSMGLLLNQAAVYGPVHNVTKCAISRVYLELDQKLSQYKAIEFTVKNNLICINGQSGNIDPMVSYNLLRRFSLLDISGVLFVYPMPAKEFEKCIKILAQPAADVAAASGVAALFKREGLGSITVVNVDYRRVEKDQSVNENNPSLKLQTSGKPTQGWGSGVIDLSDDLLGAGTREAGSGAGTGSGVRSGTGVGAGDGTGFTLDDGAGFGLGDGTGFGPGDGTGDGTGDGSSSNGALAQRRSEYKRQSEALATLLRATAATLESRSDDNPKEQLGRVMGVLEQVKAALRELTQGSQSAISSLAQSVDEDRMMVASIEAEATTRGFPLKLTREELLARYAELNQEIIQPLTVSTGVIEMLSKEQLGAMTPAQQEMLQLAQESIDRVNELVHYMTGVSGMPLSFNPDRSFLE